MHDEKYGFVKIKGAGRERNGLGKLKVREEKKRFAKMSNSVQGWNESFVSLQLVLILLNQNV